MFKIIPAFMSKPYQHFSLQFRQRLGSKLVNSFFITALLLSNVNGAVQAKSAGSDYKPLPPVQGEQINSWISNLGHLLSTSSQSLHPQEATPAPVDCVQAPESLIAYWPADGDAKDNIGGHNGNLINGTAFGTGKLGQAFSFDGVDDYIDLGNWFTFQDFTVSMWVQTGTSQQTYADIMDNNHRSGVNWVVQQNGDQLNQYSWSGMVGFGLTETNWQI